MNGSKRYYGEANIKIIEQLETINKGFMRLEYYGTKKIKQDEVIEYGIEIVKKAYSNREFSVETNSIDNIAKSEKELEEIICLLRRNKVTPIGLDDIISDLIK